MHRTVGSHHVLKHPHDPKIRVVIAMHRKEPRPGTLRRIIRDSGMSEEDFLEAL